jgi:thiamine-phosphate diphosphorylase
MTNQGGQEAPHFTKELLLSALRHLRGDFEASISGEATDERARSRMAGAQRLGLDKIAPEAIPAIDQALDDVAKLVWPGGLDQRYLGLVGTIDKLAEISTRLLPHDAEHAHLTTLAEVISKASIAAGSGIRTNEVTRMRGLYVILDPDQTAGRELESVAEQALAGGATALQLHVKAADKGDWVERARKLTELAERHEASLIVTNHTDLAVAAEAHGVHLGRTDLSLADARKVLRPWQVAGTHKSSPDDAIASCEAGVDYISITPLFPKESRVFANAESAGLDSLTKLRDALAGSGPPIVAGGGITIQNAPSLAKAGADCIAVMGAVTLTEEPERAAHDLLAAFNGGH